MKQTFVKAALAAYCMAAVACGQAPTAMGPGEYAVMTVATTDREIQSNYSASIRGRQDIAIYPQVSGTISQLCVNEGQKVAKGQTLFIIDQVPYKAALQTAEANVVSERSSPRCVSIYFLTDSIISSPHSSETFFASCPSPIKRHPFLFPPHKLSRREYRIPSFSPRGRSTAKTE